MIRTFACRQPEPQARLLALALALALPLGLACGGKGGASRGEPSAVQGRSPRPADPDPPSPPPEEPDPLRFTFAATAPRAASLPHEAEDEARAAGHFQNGYRDSAAVLVHALREGRTYVLLARRASWLNAPGTWSVFMGSVEATDLDDAGRPSFSRAAEHELYEESVTVYHRTDALALRACPTHVKHYAAGQKSKTFFSRQPYLPAEVFQAGYEHVRNHQKPRHFQENDAFRWVRAEDLLACTSRTGTFTDEAGKTHAMELFKPFFFALSAPGYKDRLASLL